VHLLNSTEEHSFGIEINMVNLSMYMLQNGFSDENETDVFIDWLEGKWS